MNQPTPNDLHCDRAGLLLSLVADDEATPAQLAEAHEHLRVCAPCRVAQAVDRAVADRLLEVATVPRDFAERVAALAARQSLEARAQNRFVATAGIAAVLAAGVALVVFGPPRSRNSDRQPGVRDRAGIALSANLAGGRAVNLLGKDR